MRPSLCLAAFGLVCPACAASVEPIVEGGELEPVAGGVCEAPGEEEPTDEACEAFSLCASACAAAAVLGCAGVVALCFAAEAPTAGTVTFPCSIMMPVACAHLGAVDAGDYVRSYCGGAT